MKELFENAADLITVATGSLEALLVFCVLLLCVIAVVFFKQDKLWVRLAIFVFIILMVVLLVVIVQEEWEEFKASPHVMMVPEHQLLRRLPEPGGHATAPMYMHVTYNGNQFPVDAVRRAVYVAGARSRAKRDSIQRSLNENAAFSDVRDYFASRHQEVDSLVKIVKDLNVIFIPPDSLEAGDTVSVLIGRASSDTIIFQRDVKVKGGLNTLIMEYGHK